MVCIQARAPPPHDDAERAFRCISDEPQAAEQSRSTLLGGQEGGKPPYTRPRRADSRGGVVAREAKVQALWDDRENGPGCDFAS